MAVQIISHKRVFLVNWLDFNDVSDLAKISRELEIARRASGVPLLYISRVVANMKAPDDKLRGAMIEGLPAVLNSCTAVHSILEGTGFSNAVQLAVVSAIIFLMRRRSTFFIHRSMDALAATLPPELQEEALAAFAIMCAMRRSVVENVKASAATRHHERAVALLRKPLTQRETAVSRRG